MSMIPKSQHRPVQVTIEAAVQPRKTKYLPRFNFRKALLLNWTNSFVLLFQHISTMENLEDKRDAGHYVPELSEQQNKRYSELFDLDPFGEETIELKEMLMTFDTIVKKLGSPFAS